MLRPATPLAIIFFLAFVLLLLSTLSVPIIKAIPIATYENYSFGVFGYCGVDTGCLSPTIGYNSDGLPKNIQDQFSLSSQARHSLSGILIVHPIAAFLALVCFGLAIAAHFHAPSHSPRYLLSLLILTIPTLLVTLLAFLVDILLFIPHVRWGGWIVLAATILIVASSVMTCAMRRTLVSRKARKKRIAENPDMNGGNYYDNLAASRAAANAQQPLPVPVAPEPQYEYPRADSPPPMADGSAGKGGVTASYEMQPQDARSTDGDDRTPLNPRRDNSMHSNGNGEPSAYGPAGDAPGLPLDANGRPRRPSRDQYGNPIPPGAYYGDMPRPSMPHRGSEGSVGSGNSGRRGRGGYGPPGGPMPMRGGFRGGPPPPGWRGRGRGGYGPPPRGYAGGPARGRAGYPSRGGYAPLPPGMMRNPPPPEYIVDSPYYDMAGGRTEASPPPEPPLHNDQYVAMPHVPIGTAIEMDERHGSPSSPVGPAMNSLNGIPDYGPEVVPGSGNQETQHLSPDHLNVDPNPLSPGPSSVYSQSESYVAPRSNWSPAPPHEMPSRLSPIAGSPIVSTAAQSPRPYQPVTRHARTNSEPYYEDVDPRFVVDEPPVPSGTGLPGVLTPAGMPPGTMEGTPGGFPTTPGHDLDDVSRERYLDLPIVNLPSNNPSFEHIPDGARSPAEGSERMSEASHFTSISQRGINPAWRPGGPGSSGMAYAGGSSASAVQRRQQDVILSANPDFSLPASRGGRGSRGRGGSGGRGAAASTLGAGLTPMGRYPTDI